MIVYESDFLIPLFKHTDIVGTSTTTRATQADVHDCCLAYPGILQERAGSAACAIGHVFGEFPKRHVKYELMPEHVQSAAFLDLSVTPSSNQRAPVVPIMGGAASASTTANLRPPERELPSPSPSPSHLLAAPWLSGDIIDPEAETQLPTDGECEPARATREPDSELSSSESKPAFSKADRMLAEAETQLSEFETPSAIYSQSTCGATCLEAGSPDLPRSPEIPSRPFPSHQGSRPAGKKAKRSVDVD
jgi:hypothetical protein